MRDFPCFNVRAYIDILITVTLLNIIFLTIEKTGKKPWCIREQIIGIVMASKCDLRMEL